MLRRPRSQYEVGRSSSLLKVKSFKDAEARVVGHLPGAGRHAGRLGALACELDDGTRFSVGTGLSDEERGAPPPIGAWITFRYQELSDDGVPRFPSYVGVRIDGVRAAPPAKDRTSPSVAKAEKRDATSRSDPSVAAKLRAEASAKALRAAREAKAALHVRSFSHGTKTLRIELRGALYEVSIREEGVDDPAVETQSFETGAEAWRAAERRIGELAREGWTEEVDSAS